MRHYVFLDVDSTLNYGNRPNSKINHALLDELLAQGVTDVYLFTSMSMNEVSRYRPPVPGSAPEEVTSRYDLIEAMRAKGFQIHGVITPGDSGYYYEDGTPKPVGAAYRELYDPIMHQLVKTGTFLDLQNYSSDPELLTAFYRNLHRFDEAMYIELAVRSAPHEETVTIPAFEACLVDRNTGETVRYLNDAERESFLHNDEEKALYSLVQRPHPTRCITIKGNRAGIPDTVAPDARFDNIKGVMMQRTFAELYQKEGPFAVTFFDDTQTHLTSTSTVLRDAQEAGMICFSTGKAPRDSHETAMSPEERIKYRDAIANTINQVTERERAAELLNDSIIQVSNTGLRPLKTRTNAAEYISANLAAADPDQLAAIANLVRTGNERLFPRTSQAAAMKCLLIAYLKAETPQQALAVKEQLDALLIQVGYRDLGYIEYPFIDGLLNALKNYAQNNASHSSVAMDMVNRMISMHLSLLASIPDNKPEWRTQERERLQEWRDLLTRASKPNMVHTAKQPQAVASSSSTAVAPTVDSEQSKKVKQFAFLDVDLTLLYNDNNLNWRYLQTLLDSGITDVYLFTNMDMQDVTSFGAEHVPMSRHAIIQRMQAMGFAVHGVVTPADNGYFLDGQPQPIGAAYRDLIEPFMTSYENLNRDELAAYRATPKHQIDLWRARLRWFQADDYAAHQRNMVHGETKAVPAMTLCLRAIASSETEFLDDEALVAFLNDEERQKDYRLDIALHPSNTITVTGNQTGSGHRVGAMDADASRGSHTKGLMMQKAAGELGPDVSILFADDAAVNLSSATMAMEDYVRAGLVSMTTCLVSKDYETAVSVEAGLRYQRSIESMLQSLSQAQTALAHGIRVVTDRSLAGSVKQKGAKGIRDHLASANSEQLNVLAQLATQGGNALFLSPSLKTAYKCLTIAYLKAMSPEEQAKTRQVMQQFLREQDYATFSQEREQDEQVADLLTCLYGISHHEATGSLIARRLLERRIEIQRDLLDILAPESPEYQREQDIMQGYLAMLTGGLYQPEKTVTESLPTSPVASSSSSTTPNPGRVSGTMFGTSEALRATGQPTVDLCAPDSPR